LVELTTALLFLGGYLISTSLRELLYLWLIMSILMVIAVYDVNHFIIPDALTVALTAVSVAWLGIRFLMGESISVLGFDVLAALLGASFFFALWAVSRGRWIGFGDVKLSIPLGLIVGSSLVFSLVVFSFWIGAVISLLLIGLSKLQGGKLRLLFPHFNLTIKSVVPFAPFMIASLLLTLFTKLNVLTLFSF
jgi:leader peptidase (prepilin peptidase)/N-methyltransferase